MPKNSSDGVFLGVQRKRWYIELCCVNFEKTHHRLPSFDSGVDLNRACLLVEPTRGTYDDVHQPL